MFYRLREKFARFMYGRYGTDELSRFLIYAAMACCILSFFFKGAVLDLLIWVFIILSYFRIFSKNHQKRYEENQKYLAEKSRFMGWFNREKKLIGQRKDFHIYTCPGCKQKIRIPRGKGKIVVKCPKCHTEFTKRS